MPKSPLAGVKAAEPEQLQAAAPKPHPQQQPSLLSSLATSARRLLRQGTWVGTEVPSFNGASMGWYQGKRLSAPPAAAVMMHSHRIQIRAHSSKAATVR